MIMGHKINVIGLTWPRTLAMYAYYSLICIIILFMNNYNNYYSIYEYYYYSIIIMECTLYPDGAIKRISLQYDLNSSNDYCFLTSDSVPSNSISVHAQLIIIECHTMIVITACYS